MDDESDLEEMSEWRKRGAAAAWLRSVSDAVPPVKILSQILYM